MPRNIRNTVRDLQHAHDYLYVRTQSKDDEVYNICASLVELLISIDSLTYIQKHTYPQSEHSMQEITEAVMSRKSNIMSCIDKVSDANIKNVSSTIKMLLSEVDSYILKSKTSALFDNFAITPISCTRESLVDSYYD